MSNKREMLQTRAIEDISKRYYSDNTLFFGEYPTGAGKSKILLESAANIVKDNGVSVIIATSNNALVLSMVQEAIDHNIGKNNVEVVIGRSNYIDKAKVLDHVFLESANLTADAVAAYLDGKEEVLTYDFISDFDIDDAFEVEICQDEESDFRVLGERRQNIMAHRKIYITNHYYLIALYRSIKHDDAFTRIPILVDEAHELRNAAQVIFSVSFSPYRLNAQLSAILDDDAIGKGNEKQLRQYTWLLDQMVKFFTKDGGESPNHGKFYELAVAYRNKEETKAIIETLNKVQKKKNISSKTKVHTQKALQELGELKQVCAKPFDGVSVSVTPIRRMGSIQAITDDPSSTLRNFVWSKNNSFVAMLSGTFCVSDSILYEDNRWSFLRLGFYPYASTESSEHKAKWNRRISVNVIFKAEQSIFSKEQARYHILTDKRFLPPKHDDEGKVSKLYNAWIKALAEEMNESLIYKNTVILMSSFENCHALADALLKHERIKENYEVFYSNPSLSIKALQEKYKTAIALGRQCILIGNLSFYVGIDLPNDYLNTLLIGKLPYEPHKLFSKYRIANSVSGIADNKNKAILTFRQGLGRGLRGEDDRVFIGICDPRILLPRNKQFLYFLDRFSKKIQQ